MKRLIIVCLCTILVCICTKVALADRWMRIDILPEGLYIICVMLGNEPVCGPLAYIDGTVEKTQELCDILNDEPMAMPGQEHIYFRWEDGDLIKFESPCKYLSSA